MSCLLILIGISVFAQQNVGIGTLTPDSSAILELQTTDKGLLIPRTDTAIVNASFNPATGLMVYQTSDSTFYYYDGAQWRPLGSTAQGPKGPTGPAGIQGIQGVTGPTGADGALNAWSITGNTGTIAGANFLGTNDVQDFAIYTNSTERIRIQSGGNVGIGATTPQSRLHLVPATTDVAGAGGFTIADDGIPTRGFQFRLDNTQKDLQIDRLFSGSWTNMMTYDRSSGNIGIGTIAPEVLLDVQGGDILLDNNQGIRIEKTGGFNKMVLELDSADFTALHSGASGTGILFKDETDTEVARITTAGNMGIGTPDPIGIATNSMLTVDGEGKYGQITTLTHSNTDPSGAFRLFG
ncbi:collagen-like protein, partial [Bacteroidales bacterium AH-315-I05]|nr:collagen-like protein [Bacteroidales bacterium AH-315-I05]